MTIPVAADDLPPAPRLRGVLRRLSVDRAAVAGIEFALLLPFLVILFIAGTEIAQALTIHRKISKVASTLGDLVAQSTTSTITTSSMSDYFNAAQYVLMPFASTKATVVVSGVYYTTAGGYKTCWSYSSTSGAKWTEKSAPPITLATGLVSDGQQLIVAWASYGYKPMFPVFMEAQIFKNIMVNQTVTLTGLTYLRPRNTSILLYAGATSTTCPAT